MKKQLEPVDLMVAIGLCATVFGGYLMFMATTGTLGAGSSTTVSNGRIPTMMDAMEWVQPALGEAIVQNYLLVREGNSRITKAVSRLNHAMVAEHRLQDSAQTLPERIRTRAEMIETDHAARVQFVLGRRIVDFTSRGIRTGILSDTQSGRAYNRSMVRLVKSEATRMNDRFLITREPMLGWEIVTASLALDQYGGQIQQQLGRAITEVTRVTRAYSDAIAGAQEQLASVALVAVHTEEIADRFDQLAVADLSAGGQAAVFSEPRSWPEVPGEYFLAACAGLIGLFCIGLVLATRRELLAMEERPEAGTPYRKTA